MRPSVQNIRLASINVNVSTFVLAQNLEVSAWDEGHPKLHLPAVAFHPNANLRVITILFCIMMSYAQEDHP